MAAASTRQWKARGLRRGRPASTGPAQLAIVRAPAWHATHQLWRRHCSVRSANRPKCSSTIAKNPHLRDLRPFAMEQLAGAHPPPDRTLLQQLLRRRVERRRRRRARACRPRRVRTTRSPKDLGRMGSVPGARNGGRTRAGGTGGCGKRRRPWRRPEPAPTRDPCPTSDWSFES